MLIIFERMDNTVHMNTNTQNQSILDKDNLITILRTAYEKGESNPTISANQLILEIANNIKRESKVNI